MQTRSRWSMLVLAAAVLGGLGLGRVEESAGKRSLPTPVAKVVAGEATVAIACSECRQLAQPAARNATLSYAQVDAVVKEALRRDQSERRLAQVVAPGDWVAIKVNIVTMPLIVKNRKLTSFWDQGIAHWGQATDLRVVKSLIDYLVNEEKDARRITIVEGGAEWSAVGMAGAATGQTEDGWSVHWAAFDSLSYRDIAAQFDGRNGVQVDIVDLNYDDWVGTGGVRAGDPLPVPDPNQTGITWYQRPEGYYVSKTLLEVDKLINVAAMKTHDVPGITLLHKQYVGTFMQRAYGERSNSKMGLHEYGNENVLRGAIDLFSYRPTDYGLLESFWATEGKGPQWGKNVQHNVVIAGGDPVAVDAVGAVAMGYNPADLEFLHLSAAKGFGTYDLDHIHIAGDPIAEVAREYEKPPTASFWGWGNRQWLVNGPHPEADLDAAALRPAEGQLSGGVAWKRWIGTERRVRLPQDYVDAQSATYAFAYIESRQAQEGYLYLGAGEELAVWLNGQPVLARRAVGVAPDALQIPVSLQAGLNPVLVVVWNTLGPADLSLVAGDEGGDTLPGIRYLLDSPVTAVAESDEVPLPAALQLGDNFPNPFNPTTVIPYLLPQAGPTQLRIHDGRGALVRTLVDRNLPAGAHQSTWDGCDHQGRPVASGVYFYRLNQGASQQVGRMALVR